MDNENLIKKLDRIESKLDKHLATLSKHEADLMWVRGYIKTSVAALLSLTLGIISTFIRTLKG